MAPCSRNKHLRCKKWLYRYRRFLDPSFSFLHKFIYLLKLLGIGNQSSTNEILRDAQYWTRFGYWDNYCDPRVDRVRNYRWRISINGIKACSRFYSLKLLLLFRSILVCFNWTMFYRLTSRMYQLCRLNDVQRRLWIAPFGEIGT